MDGSTDRWCIVIVTNERALLSGSDQPVQKLGQRHNFQRTPHLHSGRHGALYNIGNGYELNNNKGKTD